MSQVVVNGQLWTSRSDTIVDGPPLERVLAARGYTDPAAIQALLSPVPNPLSDPFLLLDMQRAVDTLLIPIRLRENIVVHGDYDADGLTATAILTRFLRRLGVPVTTLIPNRLDEGYGLSERALETALEARASALITCDCGVRDLEMVARIEALGIPVVITDHHLPGPELPVCHAVVNPQREDQQGVQRELSGAAVALKLTWALSLALGQDELWELGLGYAAIGTVADQMPLVDENRDLVRMGLEQLRRDPGYGLAALLQQTRSNPDELTARDLAWTIAPRINAAGRLGRQQRALDLLLAGSLTEALPIAAELEASNAERRQLELEARATVEAGLARQPQQLAEPLLLVADPGWHVGILGLLAARLAGAYACPVIALAPDPESPERWRGSGRAGGEVGDLYALVATAADLLLEFGGHAGAVGLAVADGGIAALRERLVRSLTDRPGDFRGDADCQENLIFDSRLYADELTLETAEAIERLEPYGRGNEEPLFHLPGLYILEMQTMGRESQHLRLELIGEGAESRIGGVWFGAGDKLEDLAAGTGPLEIIAALGVNRFRGVSRLQLNVRDIGPESADCAAADTSGLSLEDCWRSFPDWSLADIAAIAGLDAFDLLPTRGQLAAVYTRLRDRLPAHGATLDLEHLREGLPDSSTPAADRFRLRRILDIYHEAGLIVRRPATGSRLIVAMLPVTKRVDLYATATWERLVSAPVPAEGREFE
ncbi:MAG: single-stranded-DNA-specific exonuclease RecJ [Bacillota bacterium]|nr:single-stranded-DNA-specific exonuclease RecJ [Bacillota bacterium]